MTSPLGSALDFLKDFGFFEVILPFLLVFVIVYAILDKTKIFGTEESDGKKVAKRNINAMVAFVVAFFVIVSTNIVTAIQQSLPQIALILIALISFMLLAGSFMASGEFSFEESKGWKVFLTFVLFVSVILIFANSLGWLKTPLKYLQENWSSPIVTSLGFLLVMALVIYFIVKEPSVVEKKEVK